MTPSNYNPYSLAAALLECKRTYESRIDSLTIQMLADKIYIVHPDLELERITTALR